nr:hypothetical protein [Tanacetum cinerariifolium]
MFKVVKRLKFLKKPLRKLLFDHGNIFDTVKWLRHELDQVQHALYSDPSNLVLREEEAVYLNDFIEASRTEERFLQQKVKEEWLNSGDVNTAYFHKVGCYFSMGDSTAFFKEAWDIIAHDVTKAVREFFVNRVVLKELNHTIIALILKVAAPMKINDYVVC